MRYEILVLGLSACFVGCAHKGASGAAETPASTSATAAPDIDAGGKVGATASAHLEPRSGNTTLSGDAKFTQTTEGVKLVLHVTGASPGEHGAHLHEKGDCSDPEAKNAGGHWNPAGHKHGSPPPEASHLGDLGNISVAADGTGHLVISSMAWKVGNGSPEDVIGKAVVIHGGPDDLVTDPAGNSGPRIGCGVIK
jgi:superoxide dismutase, Cu-Zn family